MGSVAALLLLLLAVGLLLLVHLLLVDLLLLLLLLLADFVASGLLHVTRRVVLSALHGRVAETRVAPTTPAAHVRLTAGRARWHRNVLLSNCRRHRS